MKKYQLRLDAILFCIALAFIFVGLGLLIGSRPYNAFKFPYKINQEYTKEEFLVSESLPIKYYSENGVEIRTENDKIVCLSKKEEVESANTLRECLENFKGFKEGTATIVFYTKEKQLTPAEWAQNGVSLDLKVNDSKFLICNVMWESRNCSYRVTFTRGGKVTLSTLRAES